MESWTRSRYPLAGMLDAARAFTAPDARWRAHNDAQRAALGFAFAAEGAAAKLHELSSIASRDPEDINAFLAVRKFAIRVDPWNPATDFGAASCLDLKLAWRVSGARTEGLSRTGRTHPAALLTNASVALHALDDVLLAEIRTGSGDRVYALPCPEPPINDDDLVARLIKLNSLCTSPMPGQLVIPMITYDREQDYSWLVGLETRDARGPLYIRQAKAQTRFRMNEHGARVESTAAFGTRRGGQREPMLVIDQPFLLWIERPGLDELPEPLFIGYFAEDSWQDPRSLA